MAGVLVEGQNIFFATQTTNIVATGVSAGNVREIFEILPHSSHSYIPGRPANANTQFIQGRKYFINALGPLDLSAYGSTDITSGNGILLEDGTGEILVEG